MQEPLPKLPIPGDPLPGVLTLPLPPPEVVPLLGLLLPLPAVPQPETLTPISIFMF